MRVPGSKLRVLTPLSFDKIPRPASHRPSVLLMSLIWAPVTFQKHLDPGLHPKSLTTGLQQRIQWL